MYGLYYDTLASVPNAELYRVLPGRDAAADEAGGTAQRAEAETGKTREGFFWDRKDFSFEDVLDFINPLHHLPIVGPIYREMSGDTIGAVPRVMGDALYGGGLLGAAVGAATALVDVGVEAATGKDMGGHLVAMLKDIGNEADPAIAAMASTEMGPGRDRAIADDELARMHSRRAGDETAAARRKQAAGASGPDAAGLSHPAAATAGNGAIGGAEAKPATVAAKGTGNAWITQSMMEGLEKYRTQARERQSKPQAELDLVY